MSQKVIASRIFYAFCLLHLLVWTILPFVLRGALPHDVAEGIAWGMQWQLGYDKHPPLTAWLCALFAKLGHSVEWPVYLFAQLAIITAFYAVWRFANKLLPAYHALISVLLLEGIIFFNVKTVNITPDTLQTPFWALINLSFYVALGASSPWMWMLVGLLCGLAFITKYQAVVLFATMLLVFVSTKEGRASWKTINPYLAAGVCLVVILPHALWAYQHDFPAIAYAADSTLGDLHRQQADTKWLGHFINPLYAALSELLVVLPVLLVLWFFSRPARAKATFGLSKFQLTYLWLMGLGPFALTLLFSLLTASPLLHRWFTPYFILLGVMGIVIVKPVVSKLKPVVMLAGIAVLGIPVARYSYVAIAPQFGHHKSSDIYLPAPEMANYITALWRAKTNTPLKYVAGDHYLTAYLSVYSADKPQPFMGVDLRQSPWIDESEVKKFGAIFAWPTDREGLSEIPAAVKLRFPNLQAYPIHAFNKKISPSLGERRIAIAVLPPAAGNKPISESPSLPKA